MLTGLCACFFSYPKCIRINLRECKDQTFSGGACPQTPLVCRASTKHGFPPPKLKILYETLATILNTITTNNHLSVVKCSHIIQTVPPQDVDICLKQFDSNLRSSFTVPSFAVQSQTRSGCKPPSIKTGWIGWTGRIPGLCTFLAAYYESCINSISLASATSLAEP